MYYNRTGYYGDEMAPKRQRLSDHVSPYYSAGPASSFMYDRIPYSGPSNHVPPFPVVRLRGLPFDCTEADIIDFFSGLDIVDILFLHKGGRFSGEAFCVLGYASQVDFALQRNKQNIGRRYVEVFRSKRQEYYKAVAYEVSDTQSGSPPRRSYRARSFDDGKDLLEHTGILRLRGLPFSARSEDIKRFFKDFSLADDDVHITYNSAGRPSGDAFVKFANAEESKSAMAKDKMTLGSRYVELFPATREEMDEATSAGRPSDDAKETVKHTGIIKMRGLPFSATKEDVREFFSKFVVKDESIHITFNSNGRPTGEAFVEFTSAEDSEAAMKKDRKTLGSRYIELFASSQEELSEAISKGQ